jgi:hypothetical protein
MTMNLAGKTLFKSGGSRGIGLAIALRAARDGANIVTAAKTANPDPRLEGTIRTAAAVEAAPDARSIPQLRSTQYFKSVRRVEREVTGLTSLQIGVCAFFVAHAKSSPEQGASNSTDLIMNKTWVPFSFHGTLPEKLAHQKTLAFGQEERSNLATSACLKAPRL